MGAKPSSCNSSWCNSWLALAFSAGLACFLPTCEDTDPVKISAEDAERYGTGICSARLDCCEEAPSPDCVEAQVGKLLSLNRDDLVIDESCLSSVVEYAESLECKTIADGLPLCVLATGRGVPGDVCEFWGGHGFYAHSCGSDQFCESTVLRCIKNFFFEGLGGLTGDRCDPVLRCEIGYYCDAAQRCAKSRHEGEPCTAVDGCTADLFCSGLDGDTPGVCAVPAGLGEPCDAQNELTCERKQNENDVFVRLECVEDRCQEPGPYACEEIG